MILFRDFGIFLALFEPTELRTTSLFAEKRRLLEVIVVVWVGDEVFEPLVA